MGCCTSTSKGKFRSKILQPQSNMQTRTHGQTPIYIPTSSKESELVPESNESQEIVKSNEEKQTTEQNAKPIKIDLFRLEEYKYFEPVDTLRGMIDQKRLTQIREQCETKGETFRQYKSIQEFKNTHQKEEKQGAVHNIAFENIQVLRLKLSQNKGLKIMSEARIEKQLKENRNWAVELHQASRLKEGEKCKTQTQRIKRQFKEKAKEVVKKLEKKDQVLLFNPQHQEINYIQEGLLIRHIKGVNNNTRVMRDSLDILRYYEAQVQLSSILRGAFPRLIAPYSIILFCPLIGCKVLVSSMVPLHYSFLAHGFLEYPSLLVNSRAIQPELETLKQQFNFSETQYPYTSVLPHTSPINSCASLFKMGQHFYLHNVGFFFPALSPGPFSFAHPAAVNKFVKNSTPTSVLPLSNRLFLQCSECAQYIVDSFYYKAKTHRMTPQKLKNYVCCSGCYIDYKEYGGDLSCNPQILVKKEVPAEMKAPGYIDEKSMERENSLSKFKKHLSANIGNECLEERFYELEKLREFEKYLFSHIFKDYLASLSERISLDDLLRARYEGLGSLMSRKEWAQVTYRMPQQQKKEVWQWGVQICTQMSENEEDFQEKVKLGHPELRNEVNGELLWRVGMSLSKQEIDVCYRSEEQGEEEGDQEENKN